MGKKLSLSQYERFDEILHHIYGYHNTSTWYILRFPLPSAAAHYFSPAYFDARVDAHTLLPPQLDECYYRRRHDAYIFY